MRACKTIIMIEMSSRCNRCTKTLREICVDPPTHQHSPVSGIVQVLLARSNQRLIITINTTAVVRPPPCVFGPDDEWHIKYATNHITKGLLRLFIIPSSQLRLTWESFCQYRTQSCGSNALLMIMINDNNRYKNSKCSH